MDKNLENMLTKNLDKLTDGAKLAIVLSADAFRFGGNWGFIKNSKPEFKGMIDLLKEEKGNVKVFPVSNGALVLCNEDFLAYNVNLAVPNAIGGAFVEKAKKRRDEEKAKYSKFVDNVLAGKNSHIKKKDGYYELVLGIFSVNDTNYIRLNGNDYPAYKLNLIEALGFIQYLSKAGNKVYAKAVTENGQEVYDVIEKLGSNSKGVAALYRGLEIANSNTGVFLTLRIK